MIWLRHVWRRFNCRHRDRHHWIDTNGDGLTDTCSVCQRGVFGK